MNRSVPLCSATSIKEGLCLLGVCLLLLSPLSATSSDEVRSLPPTAQSALKKILNAQPVESIVLLQRGFSSSKLYKISTAERSYVLRLMDLKHTFEDRDREIKCMEIASREDIAPKVYYANAKEGIILMEFFQSSPLSEEEQSPNIRLPRLGHILKKLHHGPSFPKRISALEFMQLLKSELALKKIKLPNFIEEALTRIQKIEAPLQKTEELSPCHNDLNPNNILFSGNQIKIIDWEGAGMGDPYFDLATIVLFFVFDPKDEDLFLKSYFGAPPTKMQKNRLYLMKQVALCFYGLALLGASHPEQQPPLSVEEIEALPRFSDFLIAIGKGREKMSSPLSLQKFSYTALKQALNNMKTSEFSDALESVTLSSDNMKGK